MTEATSHAETYHRHDDPPKGDPSQAVTGRPADVPSPNSTLAERAKANGPSVKQVEPEQVEDKAVKASPAKKAAPKKG